MSGETKSCTVETRWQRVSDELDKLMGQFAHFESTDIIQYIQMDKAVMRKLPPEECGEIAYLLQQESIYIQLLLNELKTKMDWAGYNIAKIVANEIGSYDKYMPAEYKKHLIVSNNSAASHYQAIYNKAERLFTRLNFIPTQLTKQADTLMRYASTKERQNYGNTS